MSIAKCIAVAVVTASAVVANICLKIGFISTFI